MPDVVSSFTVTEVQHLIAEIGGNDPFNESTELFKYAKDENLSFNSLVNRRIQEREPVAYITNHSKFRNLDLFIDNRVLVPRDETEPLVEEATLLPQGDFVIDVGAGSGAVALAVKRERPDLKVLGTDISKEALDVASINSVTLGIDVEWQQADLLDGIRGEFGAVLANMPYLPTEKRSSYEPEMVEYEPQVALWGGLDGYDLIRRLLQQVSAKKSVKFIALEIGLGQETDVAEMVRSAGFPIVYCSKDKKDNIRAVVGKR